MTISRPNFRKKEVDFSKSSRKILIKFRKASFLLFEILFDLLQYFIIILFISNNWKSKTHVSSINFQIY